MIGGLSFRTTNMVLVIYLTVGIDIPNASDATVVDANESKRPLHLAPIANLTTTKSKVIADTKHISH